MQLISTTQAASMLGIHRSAVPRLIHNDRLPAMMVASRWLLDRQTVERFAVNYVSRPGRPLGWRKNREG